MRNDLLQAQASVDWAIAQTKVLTERIATWRGSKPYIAVTEPDSQPGKEIIKAQLRFPLPLHINAEAGAIIHMIRSSLDILAVALARRNGHIRLDDVYFPVAKSLAEFIKPTGNATKKIARLSDADRCVIEQLKPYDGGDAKLFALHRLDLLRKHQRLLSVTNHPRNLSLFRPIGESGPITPEFLHFGDLEDGTPLCRVPAGANYEVHFALEVTFNETPFAKRRPVLKTLRAFSDRATEIINLFA